MKNKKGVWYSISSYSKSFDSKYVFINSLLISLLLATLFFISDSKNLLSMTVSRFNESSIYIWLIFTVLFCFLITIKFRVFKMFIHPLLNKLDQSLVIVLGSAIIIRIISILDYGKITPWIFLLDYLNISIILLLIFRIFIVGKSKEKPNSIIYDLNDVLENKIDFSKPFLIRETAVGYDLLSRGRLTEELVSWIKNYQSDERFVLGIEGRWGSGKTTFINNFIDKVKSDDSIIIIDDFEPWISENKPALLDNLLKSILTKSRLEIPEREIDNLIFSITKMVLGKSQFATFAELIIKKDDRYAEQTLNDINHLLKKNNKKIIFIIDNLDRLMPSNIFLILNIVQNILKFNNLVVVLSYDKEELEKGLNSINISSKYLEKLIQKTFVMPIVNENILFNIYRESVNVLAFGKNLEYTKENLDPFFGILAENNVGLREFKRFLNSAIIPFLNDNDYKSHLDTFVIEFLRFSNFELYNKIYFNSKYFVSIDRGLDLSFSFRDNTEVNKEVNDFFNSLKIKDEYEWNLLELIFPMVKTYRRDIIKRYNNDSGFNRRDPQYIAIQKNKRIYSGKYFDLYFTIDKNNESILMDDTTEIVKKFNDVNFPIEEVIITLIKYPADIQAEILSRLDYFIEELNPKRFSDFIECMMNNYFNFGDSNGFLVLGTKERFAVIISLIAEKMEVGKVKDILNEYIEDPKYWSLFSSLIYWFEHSHEKDNTELISYLKSQHNSLINSIVQDNSYNLYSRELYLRGNVYKLFSVFSENDQEEKFENYIDSSLNEETVYRVLNDMVSSSTGSLGYSYQIRDDFKNYVDENRLKDLVYKVNPKNERQKFIKEVFENYLYGEKDDYGELAIRKNQPINLSIID